MRLQKQQITQYKKILSAWLPPTEMRKRAREVMALMGNKDFFTQPDLDFVREAWVAGEFGEKRGATAVRLINVDQERPDFALKLPGGDIELYELVEADRINRERGREYRDLAAAENPTYHYPIEEWATPEQAQATILRSARKKAARAKELSNKGTPYPPDTRLLFYVNLDDFSAHAEKIVNVFPDAVEPARAWFPTIWVLWKDCIYQV
jgi:hypothetical protein